MITRRDVEMEGARRVTAAYPYWVQLSALMRGDAALIAEVRAYIAGVAVSYRKLCAMSPIPAAFSADVWWPEVRMAVEPQAFGAPEPPQAVATATAPADLGPLQGHMRELVEAVNELAARNLRQAQELAEAQIAIGILSRVLMQAQVYSADGKLVSVGVTREQAGVLQRAMERAA